MRGFRSALMAIKMRLRAILYSPAFERPFDTFVLSFDAECLSELRSAEVTQESLADRLAEWEQYHGSTSSAPALQSMTLPLLSSLVKPPAKPKGNKRSGSRIRFPVLVSELWNGCLDVSIGRCESA